MKPIRRILLGVAFLLGAVTFAVGLFLMPVEYMLTGKAKMLKKILDFNSKVIDWIDPD